MIDDIDDIDGEANNNVARNRPLSKQSKHLEYSPARPKPVFKHPLRRII